MNDSEKLSYALGILIGQNLKDQGLAVQDAAAFTRGLQAFMSGNMEMQANEANAIINQYMQAQEELNSKDNIEAGKQFLAANKSKPGVVELPSGLQYEVMKEGSGRKPGRHDQVTTHYHGTLIDGTVFDSSVNRGQPASFGVSQVIAGWTEALQLMSEGSKWRLFIPSNLAYGSRGAGGKIGPHSTLIFEVELLKIN
jgi:FKBP-type peptidyl-prolyl cis-trans isomerase FklB